MTATRTVPARFRAHLVRLADPHAPDAALVARFAADRDEAAFAELVRRHGPTVLGVCRRITGNPHDADDAFQATFLVLARKADRVRPGAAVGAFLYGVALKAARAAIARSCRRAAREVPIAAVPDVPVSDGVGPDPDAVRAVLDEVGRLSEAYRSAVVLCELEGRPRAAAARQLGVPEGTLSSRLAAARKVLADRLTARGITPAVLTAVGGVGVPAALADEAARLAGASEVSVHVTELAEAAMRTTTLTKWKLAPALLAGLAAVGLAGAGEPEKRTPKDVPAVTATPADGSRIVFARFGETQVLSPAGAVVTRVTGRDVATRADLPAPFWWFSRSEDERMAEAVRTWAPHGRPAPDGRLPVRTKDGLYLLTPGATPTLRPVKAAGTQAALFQYEPVPYIVAWTADGRTAIGMRIVDTLLGSKYLHTKIDLAAGTAEPFNLPRGHCVVDCAPDGAWVLTNHEQKTFTLPDGSRASITLCRVTGTGDHAAVEELPTPRSVVWWASVSPDGRRIAFQEFRPNENGRERTTTNLNGFAVCVMDLTTKATRVIRTEAGGKLPDGSTSLSYPMGVRWSPDGTRVGFLYHYRSWEPAVCGWRIGVCDADGGNPRLVTHAEDATAPAGYGTFDWR